LWVIFALLDPDPDSEYGSGSTDPIEYGSNPDPDPQPCGEHSTLQNMNGFFLFLITILVFPNSHPDSESTGLVGSGFETLYLIRVADPDPHGSALFLKAIPGSALE
jgi:hypothetical protein